MLKPLPIVDAAVLAAAKRGDRRAHARLYELYATPAYTLARRMLGSKSLAEDVLHDTFIEVIRGIHAYRGDAALGFWIKRIAINKCLAYFRSAWEARRSDADVDTESLAVDHGGRGLDDQVALERALDALPDVARAVVWLHDVEGYTHREIGRLMERTTSFSKSQLARAHERLRVLLQAGDQGTTHSEWTESAIEEDGSSVCAPMLKTC
jgi:RNA polymerase sigma-70 factor (ECF subfamily)